METARSRQVTTLALLFGAMVFGMVLAGGLSFTPASHSEPPPQAPSPSASYVGNGLTGFADLADAVAPAVVSIDAATIEKGSEGGGPANPFEFFFGPGGPQQRRQPSPHGGSGEDEEYRSDAGGSGFLVSADGLLVTNNHVVEGATSITVQLDGGHNYKATVKGVDKATDLALLKIESDKPFKYLALGDSDALRVGDWVMAIGNPLGLGKTVTVGVVGAKGRSIGIADTSFENFIQTDAAINRGNSGGPLVNTRGEVVGIATAMNGGAENVGFAVPVKTLKAVLPQLRDKGKVSRGYLGLRVGNLDADRAQAFGLPGTDGALVASVDPDTPAAKAGIRHGDVVLEVDGRTIHETRDLIDYVSGQGPGVKVKLHVFRDGKTLDKDVLLEERPGQGEAEESGGDEEGKGIAWLGMRYQDLTPGLRQSHGVPEDTEGVWVSEVSPSSPLYEESLRPGDVITEVNGEPTRSVSELEERVGGAKTGTFLRFYVERFDGRGGRPTQFFAIVKAP
jgi:serine protease Do